MFFSNFFFSAIDGHLRTGFALKTRRSNSYLLDRDGRRVGDNVYTSMKINQIPSTIILSHTVLRENRIGPMFDFQEKPNADH